MITSKINLTELNLINVSVLDIVINSKIELVEEVYLKQVLTPTFYSYLDTLPVEDRTTQETELIGLIKKAVAYRAAGELIYSNTFTNTPSGMTQRMDSNFQVPDVSVLDKIKQDYLLNSDVYIKMILDKLTLDIDNNTGYFPLYTPTCKQSNIANSSYISLYSTKQFRKV